MVHERLPRHPLIRKFASWLHGQAENADEMLKLFIIDLRDEELQFVEEWRSLAESFLFHMGRFAIERVYNFRSNLNFFVVSKVLFDEDVCETFFQLFILELKTRTVAAVAEHEGTFYKADELETFLKEIFKQLRNTRKLLAVRTVVE